MRMQRITLWAIGLNFIFPAEASPPRPRIIRPNPADFSLITDFQAEWCAASLCYGKSQFTAAGRVRSVLVAGNGEKALYVEAEWPVVELLKPKFHVVGP